MKVRVIGGGLAGSEAAYQLLKRGYQVDLYEMRPHKTTGAHRTDMLGELVCSNSLKSDLEDTSSGLLKAEMRMLDCMLLDAAEAARVPAGGALAVDRVVFSREIEKRLFAFDGLTVVREEATAIAYDVPTIVATGPLTSDAMAAELRKVAGDGMSFCDAVAPIVSADSLDRDKVFAAARYGKGTDDYLNCGMNKEEYLAFYRALIEAECVEDKLLNATFYENCMPIEVMAKRGEDAMRFGPLRPVGIRGKNGEKYYAVLQLRKENTAGDTYNLVGFQTNLKFGEQKRVFGLIPGLENAEYLRYGVMHRNTYINAPRVLDETFMLKEHKNVYVAGQLSGVEGYMESTMSGLVAGLSMARRLAGKPAVVPDEYTMIGALCRYISNPTIEWLEPMNSNFGLLPTIEGVRDKKQRKGAYAARALEHMKLFVEQL
ncbi:MAG: methylenetetrahydrofolate--tRNA-(uracil(54)-C(5))-methyltransferase (FADH(2)-oxidizing) TrmFO [Clostridia bacterium]|nr:methylenetetrahydrofolate--tRNA-(uracil(54)-C(5))-methyltransferase (FADH(2)-oxidizing) TrmFO [Clostridia bacterium]